MNQIFQTAARKKSGTLYLITPTAGDPFRITVLGRDKWALDQLHKAGLKGCTPITEPHDGDFPGRHARYVLRSAACGITERGQA